MKTPKTLVFHEHGDPLKVLRVEALETPEPGPGEALVEMQAAPINPVDLNVIEGKYPVRPPLPAVAGSEGAGVIKSVGEGVRGELAPGVPVLLPANAGSWRETAVLPAEKLIPLPADIPIEQAAMLRINPPTAWRMLHDFLALTPGCWVAQNAANSGVGRAVIQLARRLGLRTVNVVRRPELIEELRREGGDAVLVDGDDLPKQIADATGGAPVYLALNAVGGESALRLANALAPDGVIVTYGAMARQPLRIPNGLLIFKNLSWRGFWITKWYQGAPPEEIDAMFAQLFPLVQSGALVSPIECVYGIDEALDAVKHAQGSRRSGKILLRFNWGK